MQLPTGKKYDEALQNPQIALRGTALANYKAATGLRGILMWSGGFAATFRLSDQRNTVALRCFTRFIPDREMRLSAISRFLDRQAKPFLTKFRYDPQGIRVEGNLYPTVTMPWIQGKPLHHHIDAEVRAGKSLNYLLDQIPIIAKSLAALGIAHGDLQHGNILVSDNQQLILVDYDGMYLPELAGLRNPEQGHIHYQHPARNDEFHPNLDRFSILVLHLALKALIEKPSLWDKFSPGGENLLFKKEDFEAPDRSVLFKELKSLDSTKHLIGRFREVCLGSLSQVPTLDEFVSETVHTFIPNTNWTHTQRNSQYPVFAGENRTELLQQVGQRVIAIGRATRVYLGFSSRREPYIFINFGDYRTGCFTVVIWSDALKQFEDRNVDLREYESRWIQVTGTVTSYKSHDARRPEQPQIIIESPLEIELLNGKSEASERLLMGSATTSRQTSGYTPAAGTSGQAEYKFNSQASVIPQPTRNQNKSRLLEISPTVLDFGELPNGGTKNNSITIKNMGTSTIIGRIKDIPTWATVTPASYRCLPGATLTIHVTVTSDAIPASTITQRTVRGVEVHGQFSAILGRIASGVEEVEIAATGHLVYGKQRTKPVNSSQTSSSAQPQVQVQPNTVQATPASVPIPRPSAIPKLIIPVTDVDFGRFDSNDAPTARISVTNGGNTSLDVRAMNLQAWASVVPRRLLILPGESREFHFHLEPGLLPPSIVISEEMVADGQIRHIKALLAELQEGSQSIPLTALGSHYVPTTTTRPPTSVIQKTAKARPQKSTKRHAIFPLTIALIILLAVGVMYDNLREDRVMSMTPVAANTVASTLSEPDSDVKAKVTPQREEHSQPASPTRVPPTPNISVEIPTLTVDSPAVVFPSPAATVPTIPNVSNTPSTSNTLTQTSEEAKSPCHTALAFQLKKPLNTTVLNEVTFEWEYTGAMPDECAFEVRLWQKNEPPLGVHNAIEDKKSGKVQEVGKNLFRLSVPFSRALPSVRDRSGEYLWTVAIVQIEPGYQDTGIQATPAQFTLRIE